MTDTTEAKRDAIEHLEELIAAQPDGSPLTPKLQEIIDEIKKLRGVAGSAAKSVHEPSHRAIKHNLAGHKEDDSKPHKADEKPAGASKSG